MIQSKQVQEWQAQARDEGRDEGRSEGRLQERREALVDLLEARYGALPAEVGNAIRGQSEPVTLKHWFLLAAKSLSLEQFRSDAGLQSTNGMP